MVTLFSTGCPRCKVLKQKLDAASIDYVINEDVSELIDLGFASVPVLKIGNEYMDFGKAIKWVNSR